MRATVLGDLARGLLDLVFAPVCLACGGAIPSAIEERLVCRTCWSRARSLPLPRCPRCWTPLQWLVPGEPRSTCALCPELPPALRAVRAAFRLDGPVRELVHALKYLGWRRLADPLGDRMAAVDLPEEVLDEVRRVVPVPLSDARLRHRGYNQAQLLASRVAARRGWECRPEVLRRTRSTETQTALHPHERRANVAGAFRVRAGAEQSIRREHVLLVDDVWTTGATALACCDALLQAGARAVSVVTLARALPDSRNLA